MNVEIQIILLCISTVFTSPQHGINKKLYSTYSRDIDYMNVADTVDKMWQQVSCVDCTTIVVLSNSYDINTGKIISQIPQPILTCKSEKFDCGNYNSSHNFKYAVLTLVNSDTENFTNIFSLLLSWAKIEKVLSVIVRDSVREFNVLYIFSKLIPLKLVDVVVAVVTVHTDLNSIPNMDDCTMELYTYFPFGYKSCEVVKSVTHLGNSKCGALDSALELYPDKTANLHKCRVKISAGSSTPSIIVGMSPPSRSPSSRPNRFPALGMDADLVRTMSTIMNFTPYLVWPHNAWKEIRGNVTMTGVEGNVFYKEAEVGLLSFRPTVERTQLFDWTTDLRSEQIGWMSPKASLLPMWMRILLPLELETWLLVIFSYLVLGAFGHLFSLLRRPSDSIFRVPFLYMFSAIVGGSIPKQPKDILARFVFAIVTIYSLVICTVYSASLVSFLTHGRYYPDIETMKDVLRSGLQFGGLPVMRELFNDPTDPIAMEIYNKWVTFYDYGYGLYHRIGFKKDIIIPANLRAAILCARVLAKQNYDKTYYVSKQIILPYPNIMLFQKNSLFRDKFSSSIGIALSTGLSMKWDSDAMRYLMTFPMFYSGETSISEDADERNMVIHLWHLLGPFCLLIAGLVIGFVAFLAEVSRQLKNRCCFIYNKIWRN